MSTLGEFCISVADSFMPCRASQTGVQSESHGHGICSTHLHSDVPCANSGFSVIPGSRKYVSDGNPSVAVSERVQTSSNRAFCNQFPAVSAGESGWGERSLSCEWCALLSQDCCDDIKGLLQRTLVIEDLQLGFENAQIKLLYDGKRSSVTSAVW